jgi:hypothetical protein
VGQNKVTVSPTLRAGSGAGFAVSLGKTRQNCGESLAQVWAGDGHVSALMRSPGDRRSRVRFEVFGAFWGTFDAGEAVRVHNLTHHGALIEAHQPLAVESVQTVCLMLDGQPALADARVRHLTDADNGSGHRYLVGVEFLTTTTAFHDAVERLVAYRSAPTELL